MIPQPRSASRSLAWGAVLCLSLASAGCAARAPALEQLTRFEGIGGVTAVRFQPQGTLLASSTSDPTIRLHAPPVAEPKSVLRGDGVVVHDLAWTRGGERLAAAVCEERDITGMHCSRGSVIVWDVASGTPLQRLPAPGAGHHHKPRPVSRLALKRADPDAVDPHSRPGAEARAVAFRPDGRRLAVGDTAGRLQIWDTERWEVVHESRPHWVIWALAWGGDGQLAVASLDNRISIWDDASGRVTRVLQHHTLDVYVVAWHPEQPLLASGSADRTVVIWDARREEIRATLDGFDGTVRAVAWHPDGGYLAAAAYDVQDGAPELRIYDTRTWLPVARGLAAPGSLIRSLSWSADGTLLASGGTDYAITIWRFTP